MDRLHLKHIGPITDADIAFGDLTVLIGPQASGKSIALQWLKLLIDTNAVKSQLLDYGTDWGGELVDFFDLYFGEGMRSLWNSGVSRLICDDREVNVELLIKRKSYKAPPEKLFLIPAQRVMTLRDGWPRPFGDYRAGDPYAVRDYSEKMRYLMETEFKGEAALFPKPNRLKSDYRSLLKDSIFAGYELAINLNQSQKRLVLTSGKDPLPYMVWSAGQREFVPLLLGLYWLMPPAKVATRDSLKWVVIEELEMGLHPQAISSLLMIVVELVARGYRVCLSTHSNQILDLVWAWQKLDAGKKGHADALLDILGVAHTQPLKDVARKALSKEAKVYYFGREVAVKDITSLDPDSDTPQESSWGGLLDSSNRANRAVARAMAGGFQPGESS